MSKVTKQKNILGIILASLITLLGFVLRIYHIGESGFWTDEAGQAVAAMQPSFEGTLSIIRQHAMAMPLDYLITKWIISFSISEGIMRLPAALWGALAILANYFFIRMICDEQKERLAILAALILCLSPYQIEYSQEMRFYAALVFFYSLSNLLLFRALKHSNYINWTIYVLLTAMGSYFHPYVLLTVVNGLLYIVMGMGFSTAKELSRMGKEDIRIALKGIIGYFTISTIALFLLFLPGYLFFGGNETYQYTLTQFAKLDWSLLVGLGLRAKHTLNLPAFGLWHVLLIGTAIIGLCYIIKSNPYRNALILLLSTSTQIIVIIGLDLWKNYFFSPRQIIHLAPIMMLLSAIGLVGIIDKIKNRGVQLGILGAFSFILFAASLPYIRATYAYDKGDMNIILQNVAQDYEMGETIAVVGDNNLFQWYLSDFYLSRLMRGNKVVLLRLNWDNISALTNENVTFLILPPWSTAEQQATVTNLGFSPVEGRIEILYSMSVVK